MIFANFQIILLAVKKSSFNFAVKLRKFKLFLRYFMILSQTCCSSFTCLVQLSWLYKRFRDSIFIIVYSQFEYRSLESRSWNTGIRSQRLKFLVWASIKDLSALLLLVTHSIKTWTLGSLRYGWMSCPSEALNQTMEYVKIKDEFNTFIKMFKKLMTQFDKG